MSNENTFSYTYNTKHQQEILSIRDRYLPREETKLEELKRLDGLVQASGVWEALCVGVIGCLVFGLGVCLCMQVIGNTFWPGILLGLVGAAGMACAFPVRRRSFRKKKEKYTPRILELTAELTGGE